MTAFRFIPKNLKKAKQIITYYPPGKQASAVIPVLDLAQRQHHNWLSQEALDYVADFLQMPRIHVYEVASFYTLFNLKPVGKYLIQICITTSCWLCGSDDLIGCCRERLKIDLDQTTEDKKFTLKTVECLGACVDAPVAQINDDYHENLTSERLASLLHKLGA